MRKFEDPDQTEHLEDVKKAHGDTSRHEDQLEGPERDDEYDQNEPAATVGRDSGVDAEQ